MSKKILSFVALALSIIAFGCQAPTVEPPAPPTPAAPEVVMRLPMTTASEEAKTHFMEALGASDVGRFQDANDHFRAAVAADPEFAIGYLGVASTATSFREFSENLQQAVDRAATASEAEQAWIASVKKGFDNDLEGQLAEAKQAASLVPESPRAGLLVAGAHAALGDYAGERAAAEAVLQSSPAFLPALAQLANSYLFNEPRDFAQAETYVKKIVELAPDEQGGYDLLGDVHRAQNNLEEAHAAYTRAAELAPENGSPLQQRGHVNSFLGNWNEARADYDAAMTLSPPQLSAAYGTWRALVSVHEGKPDAAVSELEEMIAGVDAMGLDDPLSPKIAYLNNIAIIAAHSDMADVAADAIARNRALRMERAEQVGTEENRRNQEAAITFQEGFLAAHSGDYETARGKAEEYMSIVEPNVDPRKNEPAHALMGLAALREGDHEEAVTHFEQADPADPYAKYHLGLACEGAGDTERSTEIFSDIARYNFNNAGYALIRSEAIAKAGSS